MSASKKVRTLPLHANLEWYRKAAKKKLKLLRVVNPACKLADAQREVARAQGFSSWRELVRLVNFPNDKHSLEQAPPDNTTLFNAIASRNTALVKLLIQQGADVHAANTTGATPLHMAAFDGAFDIVKLLIKQGADPHVEDDEYNANPAGWAQHAAEHMKRDACVEIAGYLEKQMVKKWSVKTLPGHRQAHKIAGWKPIMDAAFNGDATLITKLLKEGADPNIVSTTPGAHRPLHRAIEEKKTFPRSKSHEDVVTVLLAAGADPTRCGTSSRLTALGLAATQSPRFVPLLADAFKPLDIFHACVMLDLKRVKTLVAKDKSIVTSHDKNGYTPLHMLAASAMFKESPKKHADQLAIAQLLIDQGADTNATYVYQGGGEWPIPVLYFACGYHDNPALTELLLKAGAQMYDNESVYHASDEGHNSCLSILEKYADKQKLKEEATKCLRTQMHWGKSRGAKWLLEHGADPNSPYPSSGDTAIHSAARHGSNSKIIDLLLAHGGDPKLKNRKGKNAIQIAREAKKDRVVKQLQNHSPVTTHSGAKKRR